MKKYIVILLAACSFLAASCCRTANYSRHIVIAASNTPKQDQRLADLVCDGVNDEAEINEAISRLHYGGTIQLLDGDYNIDAFEHEGNSAIFFDYNDSTARTIEIIGTSQNKSYNSRYGVVLHVTEKALASMDDESTYRVFYGSHKKPEGDFFKYTFVNNVDFSKFYIMLANAGKKVICIDGTSFGNSYVSCVGIFSDQYFPNRFYHQDPANPVPGCIGIYSCGQSCDEMSRMKFDTVDVGGLYVGFYLHGIDHLIMSTCAACRCVYGYVFDGPMYKTLTMINCCDEGNTHMPLFKGKGHLTNVDFNIERFNADFIPEDLAGGTNAFMVEEEPGGWHGFISYTLQGSAFGLKASGTLWDKGSGVNFKTIDLNTEAKTW